MSLKISEKEGRIDHLQFNTYHTVQRLWKLVQRILRYFRSQRTSPVRHKIGCHCNVPWGIGKTGPGQQNSCKYLPFGEKIVKIGPVDTEIALLIVKKNNAKKEEIYASKIYSPSGKFAERAKLVLYLVCSLQTCIFFHWGASFVRWILLVCNDRWAHYLWCVRRMVDLYWCIIVCRMQWHIAWWLRDGSHSADMSISIAREFPPVTDSWPMQTQSQGCSVLVNRRPCLYRDPVSAPLRKLSVGLIQTYKRINEVCGISRYLLTRVLNYELHVTPVSCRSD